MTVTNIAMGYVAGKIGLWALGVVAILTCAVIIELVKRRHGE